MKIRLDNLLVERGLVESRSQAENLIRLKKVAVAGVVRSKPGFFVDLQADIVVLQETRYVSRAGLKLESVAKALRIDFRNKVVLDVGSSTGGFTDFSLQNGARKVVAVDVGTDQLHPKLRTDGRVELHEKTDIRDFEISQNIDIVVIDVSFISLKDILPSVKKIAPNATIVAMMKPQFEGWRGATVGGVVKNKSIRRKIAQEFEIWCRSNNLFIMDKKDSDVKGAKGNQERFYKIKVAKKHPR